MMLQGRSAKIVRLSLLAGVAAGCAKSEYPMDQQRRIGGHPVQDGRIVNAPLSETPDILPKTHLAAGRLFEKQGMIGKAIEQYRKAIAVSHDNVFAYHRLGLCLSRLKQHDAAIEALRKAVVLEPGKAVLRNDLGFELMYRDEWANAEAEFRRAIDLNPTLARAQINLGLALSKQKRFDEALVAFQATLPDADAYYNLGLMYRAQKRYADAERTFRHVLALAPKFTAAAVQLDQLAARTRSAAPGTAVAEAAPMGDVSDPVQTPAAAPVTVIAAPAVSPTRPEAPGEEAIASWGSALSDSRTNVAGADDVEEDSLPCPDEDEGYAGMDTEPDLTVGAGTTSKPKSTEAVAPSPDSWSHWRERWNALALSLTSVRDEIECLDAIDAERAIQLASERAQGSATDTEPVLVKDDMTSDTRDEPSDKIQDRTQTHSEGNDGDGRVGAAGDPVHATGQVAERGDTAAAALHGPPAELAQNVAPSRHELVDLPRRRDQVGPVPH